MQITITINTDNDAFTDNTETEVARILADYARRLNEGLTNLELSSVLNSARGRFLLHDYNGNTVGKVEITEDVPAWIPADSEPEGVTPGLINQGTYKGHRYAWNSPHKGRGAGWSLVE